MSEQQKFEFSGAWPVSSIQGQPSITSGHTTVVLEPDGSAVLAGIVGPAGARPKDCNHFEFVLNPQQTLELGGILHMGSGPTN